MKGRETRVLIVTMKTKDTFFRVDPTWLFICFVLNLCSHESVQYIQSYFLVRSILHVDTGSWKSRSRSEQQRMCKQVEPISSAVVVFISLD
jgi:hypothetical protein